MEQLLIQTDSAQTAKAIKQYVSQFDDASIEEQMLQDDDHYQKNYGMNKASFEHQLNVGIAQMVLGMNKNWDTIKEELLAKVIKK